MNKEIKRLLEILKIFDTQGVLEDEFNAFAENFKENEKVSLEQLINLAEDEMSYWEID